MITTSSILPIIARIVHIVLFGSQTLLTRSYDFVSFLAQDVAKVVNLDPTLSTPPGGGDCATYCVNLLSRGNYFR